MHFKAPQSMYTLHSLTHSLTGPVAFHSKLLCVLGDFLCLILAFWIARIRATIIYLPVRLNFSHMHGRIQKKRDNIQINYSISNECCDIIISFLNCYLDF